MRSSPSATVSPLSTGASHKADEPPSRPAFHAMALSAGHNHSRPATLGRRPEVVAAAALPIPPLAIDSTRKAKGSLPMRGIGSQVNFDAPAVLRKWPSLRNERLTEGAGSYLLIDGTIDECIREFMAKPSAPRHLYEIHAAPQPPWLALSYLENKSLSSHGCGTFSD